MLGALAQVLPDRVPAAGEGGNTVFPSGGQAPRTTSVHRGHDHGRVGRSARPGRHGGGDQSVTEHVELAGGGPRRRTTRSASTSTASCRTARPRTLPRRPRPAPALHAPERRGDAAAASDRMRFLPYGLAGGRSGARHAERAEPDGEARSMPAKFAVTPPPRRRRCCTSSRAAAATAIPSRAIPERVAEDVRDEKISLEFARREHGVVIDPVTLAVDAAATPGSARRPRVTRRDCGARSSAPGRLTLSAASTRLPTIPTPRHRHVTVVDGSIPDRVATRHRAGHRSHARGRAPRSRCGPAALGRDLRGGV